MFQTDLQKGVSLIITFLIMTIMLAMVLSISLILFSQVKIIGNIGNSVIALYAAQSGAERVLYFDRKQIPPGASRGFCNLCNSCSASECLSCQVQELDINGCNVATCNNCQITYQVQLDDKTYEIDARVNPSPLNENISIFHIQSKGSYKETSRSVEVNAYSNY